MTIAYSGDQITFPDITTQASAQVGLKNRVIDGGFILNQRVYVSGTSLASGVYGHDRWKGGASGGTYTFTQGALGVNTTITITAGSIIQVIEGCNVAEGGTYVLSWTGTAQGRLNGGTYGASGTVTVTGWTAGTNLNVEFNTGTCGSVQLEKGSTATSFDYRDYGRELIMCQRYLPAINYAGGANPYFGAGMAFGTTSAYYTVSFTVTPRVPPTGLTVSSAGHFSGFLASTGVSAATGISFGGAQNHSAFIQLTGMSGLIGGNASLIYMNNSAAQMLFTGCEL